MSKFRVVWACPETFSGFLSCWPGQNLGGKSQLRRDMWVMLLAAVYWAIWEERNRRTFEDKDWEKRKVLDSILSKIFSWLFIAHKRGGTSLPIWMFNWETIILED